MLIAQTIMAGATNGVEREAGTFFDNGSTLCLALHHWAKAAGCPSTPYKLGLRVVGKESYENVDTRLYTVALKADTGELDIVKCIGMDTISHIAKVDSIDEVAARLQLVEGKDLLRPAGEADILIGTDRLDLHPKPYKQEGQLVLYTSRYGTGWALGGVMMQK